MLINPKVIVEVLSPSTEVSNSHEKFRRYRMFNPSLTDYLYERHTKIWIDGTTA